ncbi:AAA family ATPase [bacterium]|nr:AAA family ATPase [bacterium]NUN46057.1 AAA family ATPase [bacterium]
MNRDWSDFKALHGNIEGARKAFEIACENLFRKMYSNQVVSQVEVKHGDGGIDVFIGKIGIEPITVVQCKFFLESFSDSQKQQIRKSFDTARESDNFELKSWILCIPSVLDIDQARWWEKWKSEKIVEHSKTDEFIKLINGNELINLLKEKDLYNTVFRIEDSLRIQEMHQTICGATQTKESDTYILKRRSKPDSETILFNSYSQKSEPFYLKRKIDDEFIKFLSINNIWVFGKSGVGKTTLINRNLLISDIDYCFCDLSPVNIRTSNDVLEEVLCRIEDKYSKERNQLEQNVIKQIVQLLAEVNRERKVIVIDELPLIDITLVRKISDDLTSLVNYYGNKKTDNSLKFVISTIADPSILIKNWSKASDFFQYINCNNGWNESIELLFCLIQDALRLNLDTFKCKIIEASSCSPRRLKAILRRVVSSEVLNAEIIDSIIKQINQEIIE